jgi:uncharacterized protein YjdB
MMLLNIAILFLFFAGCTGGSGSGGGSVDLISIQVTPTKPEIAKDTSVQFTAIGTYSNSTTKDITKQVSWTSSASATATIDTAGLATGIAPGTTTIAATLSGITGSTTLTVDTSTLTTIEVTPANPSIAKNTKVQFTATGHFSDGDAQDLTRQVTWTSSAGSTATIDTAGLATGIASGATTISATRSGITGSTTLTVDTSTLTSIVVTPANPSIAANTKQQFTAMGRFSDGDTQDLTRQVAWTSSAGSTATIDTAGLATGIAPGTTMIAATLSGINGSTTLTINAFTLKQMDVTPVNPSITVNGNQQFTATGTFSDGSKQDITKQVHWTTLPSNIATVDSNGLATGIASGGTAISATLSGISGSTTLTVNAAPSIPDPLADNTEYFQILIDNRIGSVSGDKKIHFLVKAKKLLRNLPDVKAHTWLTGGWNGTGWTDWNKPVFHVVNSTTGNSSDGISFNDTYDVTLDKLPLATIGTQQYRVLKIPFLDPTDSNYSLMGSGRLYYALGEKVWTQINPDFAIAEPNPEDTNAGGNTRFDFMEVNCATCAACTAQPVCYVNTTNVDFFSLGVTIKGRDKDKTVKTFGLNLDIPAPVQTVIGALERLTGDYALGKKYVGSNFIRFASPSKSFPDNSTAMANYIKSSYDYYSTEAGKGNNTLEFKIDGRTFKATVQPNAGSAGGADLVFSAPSSFTLAGIPTTKQVVSAPDAGPFQYGGKTNDQVVAIPWVNAFLNRGVFTNTGLWNYAGRELWYPAGGVYNEYSKTIHDYFIAKSAYGLPYDEPGGLKNSPTEPSIQTCTSMTLVLTID